MRFLITGGAGFMGSNFVRYLLKRDENFEVLVYDKLTYAGRIENLQDIIDNLRLKFVKADICDEKQLLNVIKEFQPDVIVNLAGETHVDRSINEPAPFLRTNVFGIFTLLEVVRKMDVPKILHVSSVTGDTPVLLRDKNSGNIFLTRIDFLNQGNYNDYEALTIDENYNVIFKSITNIIVHEADELYELEYEGGGKIRVTGSHSVFVWDREGIREKYISEIRVGDKLVTLHAFKRNNFEKTYTLKINDYVDLTENERLAKSINVRIKVLEYLSRKLTSKGEIKETLNVHYETLKDMLDHGLIKEEDGAFIITMKGLRELSCGMMETKKKILRHFHNIPGDVEEVEVTPELMWLFGLYLAEGHASHTDKELKRGLRKVSIVSLNREVLNEARKILEKYFKYSKANLRERSDNLYSLEFCDKILHNIFSQFGCTSEEKRIPGWVWYLPKEHIEMLLKGYAEDAHVKSSGSRVYTSKSDRLVRELLWLCRLKGISSRINRRLCKNMRGEFQKKPSYDLEMFNLTLTSDNYGRKSIRMPHSKCIPIEVVNGMLSEVKDYSVIFKEIRKRMCKPNKVISKDKLMEIIFSNKIDVPQTLINFLKSDIGIAIVKSIRKLRVKEKVYDIEIKGNNKFFGGIIPILLHNTDEVYGDLREGGSADELHPFRPSSPYSVSKASGDLMALAYHRTYGLPVIVVRPSNNYGPYQFPEKLIPKTIIRALHGRSIPIYGKGDQVRDWLYVEDFCEALHTVILKGRVGEPYNIPGFNERRNIEVVASILKLMNKPLSLIKYVEDRPGHDFRYSMKGDKILALGWKPKTGFMEGLKKTIDWYLSNEWWWKPMLSDDYFVKDTPWRVRK